MEECYQTERNFFFLVPNMHIFILHYRRGIISIFFSVATSIMNEISSSCNTSSFFRYWSLAARYCNAGAAVASCHHLSSRLRIVGIPVQISLENRIPFKWMTKWRLFSIATTFCELHINTLLFLKCLYLLLASTMSIISKIAVFFIYENVFLNYQIINTTVASTIFFKNYSHSTGLKANILFQIKHAIALNISTSWKFHFVRQKYYSNETKLRNSST